MKKRTVCYAFCRVCAYFDHIDLNRFYFQSVELMKRLKNEN